MNDPFEKKIRAAAIAGWWVVLIAVVFLTLIWLIYLAVMSTHPTWLLTMWGPGVDWPFVQSIWFWVMVAFKFCVWLRTLILEGWGIHYSVRGGWVWNLWGRDCVVVHLNNGSVLRIGTDDAPNLTCFLEGKVAQQGI